MMNVFHALIVACLLMVWQGCGFQGNPYYGSPSTAKGFNDLSALESKIE